MILLPKLSNCLYSLRHSRRLSGRVRINAIRPDAVAEGDQLAPIVEEEPGAEDDEYIN